MRAGAALLASALLLASPATAQTRCLTAADAEAVTLVALPEIIRQAGLVCSALPASSLLRRQDSKLLARYDAEADRAWPAARSAITKLSDPAVEMLLLSDYARPLLVTMFAPQITGRIAVRDCPTIDRMVTLLEPLPPRNTAGVIVATLQYLKADRARRGERQTPDLPLCPAAEAAAR